MEVEIPYRFIATILLIAAIVGFLVNQMYNTPVYPRIDEGFYAGVARGSGQPDCLRTLSEASALLELLDTQHPNQIMGIMSDRKADRSEMELLLSKMACLKKDLLSPSETVDATRYQAFETAHDRMAVGELCGMCLQQTISKRDLEIVFITWRDRGNVLLRKLCTEYGLTENNVKKAEKMWKAAWSDIYEIATSRCLKRIQPPSLKRHDAMPFEPEHLRDIRTYDYRYGELSASGWNGSI